MCALNLWDLLTTCCKPVALNICHPPTKLDIFWMYNLMSFDQQRTKEIKIPAIIVLHS